MTTADGRRHWDKLTGVSYAPGYRDLSLRIVLHTREAVELNLTAADAMNLYREIRLAFEFAFCEDRPPLDFADGERPYALLRKSLNLPNETGSIGAEGH